ncbi:MAG TPA: acyl-CoA carboxylase subunit epsilon [Pseudonocardia sp.]|uniref:acyl-CoA carboxylase subunit epsilon n=1 Tax=Pseudonocardia sp. TaxID=60912 RepID=UPI002BFDFB14|nr:acyl-CoA carboxylase subunit epsilon [Pseudonocardia sp.]HTF47267.1 acyl-CoA carboxylase subunit epsilon [Pseudonocardia sp.]
MSTDATEHEEQTPEQRRALFRVVRGEPDDAELAALAVVLAAAASAPATEPGARRTRSVWVDRAAMLRRPEHPGPGAWRASALPR